ncbi:protein white-like [Ruditapes philippinarum]|uniref:protein white-like n=1 Tax=Ruditapes philippinarum TaxID=129788 RepID=UPI00295B29DB|nr:protein white-like [Ruditapes philippinarum]
MGTMLSRTAKTTFRDTLMLSISIGETLGMALLHGLLFLRRDNDQVGVMDINGALFLMMLNFSVTSMYAVLNTFPAEVPIFVREYSVDLYRIDVYYISKMLVELPSHLIMPIAFCSIAYYMIGLYSTFEAFLIFTGIQTIVANVSVSFGYLISAGSPSAEVAIGIAAPAVICFMMFGGLFMNADSFPVYFVWLEYLSWFKYAGELITLNQWENIESIDCDAPAGSDQCLFSDGQSVIDYYNYDKDNKQLDIILLCVMLVGFRILGFIVLLVRAKLSRN